MSPTLALTLSFEGIGLLTRVDSGWHLLGEVGLDSPDLAGDLAKLRDMAANQAGDGFGTLLVLPNDQIKFLSLKLGRKLGAKAEGEVARILEEETPYSADQLVFDTCTQGAETQIAAVAKETLAEAEAFAAEYAFNPVRFTAMPESADFAAAPDFGPTSQGQGAAGAFDGTAIVVVGSGPLPPAPEPVPEIEGESLAPQTTDSADVSMPLTVDAAESTPDTSEAPPSESAPVAFASRRQPSDLTAAPELGGVSRDAAKGVEASPTLDAPLRFDPSRVVSSLAADGEAADTAPTADTPPSSSFFSRRKPKATKAEPNLKAPVQTDPDAADATVESGADTLVAELPDAMSAERTARRKVKDQEKERLTVFGSRQEEVRGKPRHLGLILTTLLLLFLALVALWATFFVEDGVAGLFGERQDDVVVIEPQAAQPVTPQPQTEAVTQADDVAQSGDATQSEEVVLAPQALPALEDLGAAAEVDTATIDPDNLNTEALPPVSADTITDSAEIEALLDAEDPRSLSDDEAEARYAVTGIWQKAPLSPLDVQSESSEDIYVPSIDHDLGALDAIALPADTGLLTDASPASQINPPAQGTQFAFDERGLVIATPEGALTPEGILVFAGRPQVEPPNYPKRINVAQALQERDERLANRRPRLRPADLIETNERATLGGLTRSELALKRPKLRPASAKEAEEADTTPTALAVASSPRPRVKPSNIAQLAQRATPSVTEVAATPAAATITPSIPTTASVARQATIQNAINLKKINLIGVYGTSSNRRALIRLSNGRYKKVQVGDRIDGGKVAAIGESELRYVKSGKNITLKMPKG
ncbi:hypothetical protein [Shimia haliotis]|uniref:Type IV pilus biogenesis protein PilP n=1 Tax=Shimia haliotis TaxID=1280847 RepID=A0A1I4A1R1_9RHOB|nr:hypothetical protein [Shimia haliotis]SFK50253.1 hypothetical protein SAMN04488036_101112 [Shimia haliotis]